MRLTRVAAGLVLLVASFASAQWLETVLDVPEQYCGSLLSPQVAIYNSANGRVYVGGAGGTEVVVLDCTTGVKVAKIPVGSAVNDACCDATHNKVYIVTSAGKLVAVDGEADTVLAVTAIPNGATDVCYAAQEDKIYSAASDAVTVADGATYQIVATIPKPSGERTGLCYYPPGNKLYCTSTLGKVLVIDCPADTVIDTIPVGDWAHRLCYDSVDDKIYSANFNDDNLTVIDPQADAVLATIAVPGGPLALCYAPQHNKLFCASGGAVTMVDPTGDSVASVVNLPVDVAGRDVYYKAHSDKVYCASSMYIFPVFGPGMCGVSRDRCLYDTAYGLVTVVDGATGTFIRHLVVGLSPEAISGWPGGDRVFVTNYDGYDVAMLDASSDSVLEAIALNGGPRALCWAGTGNKTYCGNRYAHNVTVVDGHTDSVLKSIPVGGEPLALCYNSINNKVYCGIDNEDSVKVIGVSSDSVIATVAIAGEPRWLCYSGRNNRIYCAVDVYNNHGKVAVIDGASNALVTQVAVGNVPWMICYNPSSNKVYCANLNDNSVSVVNCSTNTVVATVPVGGSPAALCCNPRDNKVYCSYGSSVAVIDGALDYVIASLAAKGTARSLCYNASDNKVYCAGYVYSWRPPLSQGWVSIYDGQEDTVIVHRLLTDVSGTSVCSLCCNSQNDKVYCSDYGLGVVWVIDGASDSLICSIDVPGGPMRFTWNTADNRTYVSCYKASRIAIIRDSLVLGVQETPSVAIKTVNDLPTVARGVLFLPGVIGGWPRSAVLLDVGGRKVTGLHAGANDVRALAPGVYFVGEGLGTRGQELGRIRKVVLVGRR